MTGSAQEIGKWAFCLTLSLATTMAGAKNAIADELLQLASAEQGWAVSFLGPDVVPIEVSSEEGLYRYFAKSDTGLFLSLHAEPLAGEGNTSCLTYFHNNHAKGVWNLPDFVDKSSITIKQGGIEELRYQARISYQDTTLLMPNRHYYFALNGYCADLHFAARPNFDTPDRSFAYYADQLKTSLVKTSSTEVKGWVSRETVTTQTKLNARIE